MTLHSLEGNRQRLDGGAMFGNAPRAVWQRWIAPDEQHRIPLACRCFLWRAGGRTVLLETGIGAFFAPPLRARYGVVESTHVLLESLAAIGVAPAEVDVIVLSHLHFDHAGGLLARWHAGVAPTLAFPSARVIVSAAAWQRSQAPHPRDRASYIPELGPLLEASGRLEVLPEGATSSEALGPGARFHYSDGHTPGLLLTELALPGGPAVFAADLIPGKAWVHLPITMGYDRFPERLIDEKAALLEDLVARGGRLLFTHDPDIAMARVVRDDDGRYGTTDDVATIAG